jgi:hypothetical protein
LRGSKPGAVGHFDGGAFSIKICARPASDGRDKEENSIARHL